MPYIIKQDSKVVHQGYAGGGDSNTGRAWCNTSGWKHIFREFKGKIKPPYRKCKICFRGDSK